MRSNSKTKQKKTAKKFAAWLLFLCAGALIACGVWEFILDSRSPYYLYGSAPLYVYGIQRGIEFGIPAILCVILGAVLLRKAKGRKS